MPNMPEIEHSFNEELLVSAFQAAFPLRDGSTLAVSDTALVNEALWRINELGVPLDPAQAGTMSEATLLEVYMRAALGTFVNGTECAFQTDPVTARIVPADTWYSNRVLVFQVLVILLLICLARLWFVLPVSDYPQIKDRKQKQPKTPGVKMHI